VVKALVPTAVAAILLSQEFPSASLDTDGTLFTVIIYGMSYSDSVTRIRTWMRAWKVGPVLVTDDETAEELLDDFAPLGRRAIISPSYRLPARPGRGVLSHG
jgi:hypothetical protein